MIKGTVKKLKLNKNGKEFNIYGAMQIMFSWNKNYQQYSIFFILFFKILLP